MSIKTRVALKTATKIKTRRVRARGRLVRLFRSTEQIQQEWRQRIYRTQQRCRHPRPSVAC
jgi:hypothetical protein